MFEMIQGAGVPKANPWSRLIPVRGISILGFRILNLFRVSIFEFRI